MPVLLEMCGSLVPDPRPRYRKYRGTVKVRKKVHVRSYINSMYVVESFHSQLCQPLEYEKLHTSLRPIVSVRSLKYDLAIFLPFQLRQTHEAISPKYNIFGCAHLGQVIQAAALEHTMVAKPLLHINAVGGAISK